MTSYRRHFMPCARWDVVLFYFLLSHWVLHMVLLDGYIQATNILSENSQTEIRSTRRICVPVLPMAENLPQRKVKYSGV